MMLVMTLLVRDEADVIDANIAYHLNAGVDLVVVTDNGSRDGTAEILESYERSGCLHLIRESATDMRQGAWVTRMAQLAARELGADWLIHADADEFYWPRGGNLKDVLAPIPARFGSFRTFVRTFLLGLGDDGAPFFERMTVRLSALAPIHDPASIFRPGAKLIHRAHPDVVVGDGTHVLHGVSLPLLSGYEPVELLHFPFRAEEQIAAKFRRAWLAWTRNPMRPPPHYYAKAYSAIAAGRESELVDSLTIDEQRLERGLREGVLVVDTRLRDALRDLRASGEATHFRVPPEVAPLRSAAPDLADRVRYAVESAVLDEADVIRLQRRIDDLETRRLSRLERS